MANQVAKWGIFTIAGVVVAVFAGVMLAYKTEIGVGLALFLAVCIDRMTALLVDLVIKFE